MTDDIDTTAADIHALDRAADPAPAELSDADAAAVAGGLDGSSKDAAY